MSKCKHWTGLPVAGPFCRCLRWSGLAQTKGQRQERSPGLSWVAGAIILSHHLLPSVYISRKEEWEAEVGVSTRALCLDLGILSGVLWECGCPGSRD